MLLYNLGCRHAAQFFFWLLAASCVFAQPAPSSARPTTRTAPKVQPATPAIAQNAPVAVKVNYAERYAQTCQACHGAKGEGVVGLAPILAGQPSFYVITQLFLFKNGRRGNEAMLAISKDFSNDDLRGFSDYIGILQALPTAPSPTPIDGPRMLEGRNLAEQHQCVSCHSRDFSGAPQVPRLAGQHEDYLLRVLQEFKSAKRLGYTAAMSEALTGVKPEELETLAYYLARLGQK